MGREESYELKQILEETRSDVREIRTSINNFMIKTTADVASLKVKSGVWGVLGGCIPVVVGLGVWAITKG